MLRTLLRSASLLSLAACIVDYDVTGLPDPVLDTPAEPVPEPVDPPATEQEPTPEPPPVDDPAPEDDCVVTADGIYALARDGRELYLFDPGAQDFTYLGDLDCSAFGSPNSMGVGRDGVGYVRWSDDTVYEVDLTTLACQPSGYRPRSTSFGAFGMGYATDTAGTWRDKLYIANADTLARLDTSTWQLQTVGPMPSQSELTGNAAGELWAFFPLERPAAIARLSKSTGQPEQILSLPNFPAPQDIDAFAFAQWGGDFYLFVRTYGVGSSTDILRVTAAGTMTTVASRIGVDIIGAGVSTCAPVE
jgi:hypothetical protein